MTDKPLTVSEMASMGGQARAEQLTPEERQKVAKKGGEKVKRTLGPDHFKRMNELSQASKRKKKEAQQQEPEVAPKKTRSASWLNWLKNEK